MRVKFSVSTIAAIIGIAILIFACGRQKETLRYEPPPVVEPEPEAAEEQPEAVVKPEKSTADEMRKMAPVVLAMIHFDFDKADLRPEAKAILAENARTLEENPHWNIRIEGHCDERGTVEYNLALGERRAISARNYLINYGIAPHRITIISYGKERPLDARHNEEAWAKNRRAEFIILNP